MTLINDHLVARFFPATNSPLGTSLGWMVLALAALGIAVILLALVSVFKKRRPALSYASDDHAWEYAGETYGDTSFTGNDAAWLEGSSSSWLDSSDTSSSCCDFDSSGGDFGSSDSD